MNRTNRKLNPEQQARVARARKAAEGEEREDLIQQARKAQAQALEESPEQVMAVLKAAREAAGISLRSLKLQPAFRVAICLGWKTESPIRRSPHCDATPNLLAKRFASRLSEFSSVLGCEVATVRKLG